ncbi:hypothetical protein ONS95_002140 [Cadophora gregata]|uniref:uncharacterized protein n=1 Tax=Cadophora gregata TaxID=51156 RepID=UPI0026DBAB33|nr:uncharacterized protein ONS95_002140 [Cadophora gregata]KAK0109446.1 hypothetical protein ONS95_002140 [Cadophora gregata]KAK0110926.1 hypothetical protein ONS96_002511 [Cadophora gregata f. sp. sojae]
MAPNNDDAQYKMSPARLQNIVDEAAAQETKEINTFNVYDFIEPEPSKNRRTRSRSIKPPTKASVFFTYTKSKPKAKKTRSGEMQYHVIAEKGTRKDKRKAMEAVHKLADEHDRSTETRIEG